MIVQLRLLVLLLCTICEREVPRKCPLAEANGSIVTDHVDAWIQSHNRHVHQKFKELIQSTRVHHTDSQRSYQGWLNKALSRHYCHCCYTHLLTCSPFAQGRKAWFSLVPGIFRASRNLSQSAWPCTETSSWLTQINLMPEMCFWHHWNSSVGVRRKPVVLTCRLARALSRFTVPPTPSQGLFPWDVAKKCHFWDKRKPCFSSLCKWTAG